MKTKKRALTLSSVSQSLLSSTDSLKSSTHLSFSCLPISDRKIDEEEANEIVQILCQEDDADIKAEFEKKQKQTSAVVGYTKMVSGSLAVMTGALLLYKYFK